ncbi:MAG: carboxypeptidase regulatory-like domain-containing protein [Archangiaceae bacterium]|nr:carboxypeptidase regulatory-like domain-containing protein [Archangiaceae bacterium]
MKLALGIGALACLLLAVAFQWAAPVPVVGLAEAGPPPASAEAVPAGPDDAEEAAAEAPGTDPVELAEADSTGLTQSEPEALGENVVLSGRVMPEQGASPEGVHLVLEPACLTDDAPCESEVVEGWADETGEFSIVLSPGVWNLAARAEGYLPAHEEGLLLTRGEELGDLVLTLQRGERIVGSVAQEGEAAPDVSLVITGNGYTRTAFTDEWGRFAVEGLPRGTYTVRAFGDAWGGDQQTVSTGSSVSLNLERREKVFGRVLDARGFGVEGLTVYSDRQTLPLPDDRDPYPAAPAAGDEGLGLHGCSPMPGCYPHAVTDAAGRFVLFGAQGETLTLFASRPDGAGARLGGAVPGDPNEVLLTLEPPAAVELSEAEAEPIEGLGLLGSRASPENAYLGGLRHKEPVREPVLRLPQNSLPTPPFELLIE